MMHSAEKSWESYGWQNGIMWRLGGTDCMIYYRHLSRRDLPAVKRQVMLLSFAEQ